MAVEKVLMTGAAGYIANQLLPTFRETYEMVLVDVTDTDPGACCDGATGVCVDDSQADDCTSATQVWTANEQCANVSCSGSHIPAISEWGLIALTLALLTLATLLLQHKRQDTA